MVMSPTRGTEKSNFTMLPGPRKVINARDLDRSMIRPPISSVASSPKIGDVLLRVVEETTTACAES